MGEDARGVVRSRAEHPPHRFDQRVPEPVLRPCFHVCGGTVLLTGRRLDSAPDAGPHLVLRLGLAIERDVVDRVGAQGRPVLSDDENAVLDLDAQIRVPRDAVEQAGERFVDRVDGRPRFNPGVDIDIDFRVSGEGEEELTDGDVLHRDGPGLRWFPGLRLRHGRRHLYRTRDRRELRMGESPVPGGGEQRRAAGGQSEQHDQGRNRDEETQSDACPSTRGPGEHGSERRCRLDRGPGRYVAIGSPDRCFSGGSRHAAPEGVRPERRSNPVPFARRRIRIVHVPSTFTEWAFCEEAAETEQGETARLFREIGAAFVGIRNDGGRHAARHPPRRGLRA